MSANVMLPLDAVRRDGGTQMRVKATSGEDYAEDIAAGATFPPVVVFLDAQGFYWLADGFRRHDAHYRAGRTEIACDVRQGERRDAVLYACGANETHGLRRADADRRRALRTLLLDPEWRDMDDAWLIRTAKVTLARLASVREEIRREGQTAVLPPPKPADPVAQGVNRPTVAQPSVQRLAPAFERPQSAAEAHAEALHEIADYLLAQPDKNEQRMGALLHRVRVWLINL